MPSVRDALHSVPVVRITSSNVDDVTLGVGEVLFAARKGIGLHVRHCLLERHDIHQVGCHELHPVREQRRHISMVLNLLSWISSEV